MTGENKVIEKGAESAQLILWNFKIRLKNKMVWYLKVNMIGYSGSPSKLINIYLSGPYSISVNVNCFVQTKFANLCERLL